MGKGERSEKIVRKRREWGESRNHWVLAVGFSSTQETVKTAGGRVCVCESVCVCVFDMLCVCACVSDVCVSSRALLSLKETEAGRCF